MNLYTLFFEDKINIKNLLIPDKYGNENKLLIGGNNIKGMSKIIDDKLNIILNKFNAINIYNLYFYKNNFINEIKNKTILKKYNYNINIIFIEHLNKYKLYIDGERLINLLLNDKLSY